MKTIILFLLLFSNIQAIDYSQMVCAKEYRNSTYMEFDSLRDLNVFMRKYNIEKMFIRRCDEVEYTQYCPWNSLDCNTNLGSNDRKGNRLPKR